MNIIELQDNLKELPDSALMKEMQMPSGNAPQFLVLSELKRRKRMRDEFQRREAADMPTVAEETITAAGMPQQGIMQAARAMAPKSSIAQNTGMDMAMPMQPTQAPQQPQMMADGGVLSLFRGGRTKEDLYRQVEPFPENGTASERRTWNLTYGMTHNLDGTPKRMPPNEVTTDLSDIGGEGIGEVSADIKDFVADSLDDNLISEENRLDQQEIAANIRNQNLPSLSQIDSTIDRDSFGFDGNEASFDDLLYQAQDGERFPPIIEREFSNQIDFNAAEVPANILERNLADKLQFAVDADERNEMMDRLENIDTPPPSVLAAQTDANQIQAASTLGPMQIASLSYDELLKKAQSGLPITEDDLVQSVEAGLLNDQQAADINSIIDNPDYMPTQIEQDIANNPADLSFPDAPANPNLLFPKIAGGISDYVGGVFGGRTVGEQAEIDAARKRQAEEYDNYIQSGGFASGTNSIEVPVGSTTEEIIAPKADERRDSDPDLSELLTSRLGQTTGEGLVIPSEEDGGIASLLPPSLTGGDAGGDAGGTSKGGADFGSIESRIARMLADREKSAEADKWMSLAQAGMALMASKNPTFGGALGEAGLAGIGSMQKARSQYDKDILGLLGMQQQIESAKDLASYRQGSLDAKGDSTKSIGQQIDDARAYLNSLTTDARSYRRVAEGEAGLGTEDRIIDMTPPDLKADIIAAQDRLNRLERLRSGVTEPVYDATK